MNIVESIVSSISSVLSNKMRSLLTMLGIIIGIGSVIMITSVGEGVQNEASASFSLLGLDVLAVSVNRSSTNAIRESDNLTLKDIDTIRLPQNVDHVSPVIAYTCQTQLKNPTEQKNCQITGATPEHMKTQPSTLMHGRYLTDVDVTNSSKVCLIDSSLAKSVFGIENAVGQKITFTYRSTSTSMTIVGIIEGNDFGALFDIPGAVTAPITTVQKMFNITTVSTIYITVKDKELADHTASEIDRLLSISHNNEGQYNVQNYMNQAEMLNEVMGYLTTFVALVAGISLVVGGIGVMNIMLVTVTERTREIGIRKSLGATNNNIRLQFLIEATILTVIGGIIGILVGYFGGYMVSLFVDVTPSVSLEVIILTVSVSSIIGIVFGVYPADKAAKLDPIEALRYE